MDGQDVAAALIVVAAAAWIGGRMWRWARRRRSATCPGCSRCGGGG